MDYYRILGVKETASTADIKAAFRKLALKWHPDKHPNEKAFADARFKSISRAYQCLISKNGRDLYNFCHPQIQAMDAIEEAIGNRRGNDTRVAVAITSTASITGCKTRILVPHTERCSDCQGLAQRYSEGNCYVCQGTGLSAAPASWDKLNCSVCNGTGKLTDQCPICRGTGVVHINYPIELEVPPACPEEIIIPEMGEPGFDGYGDLRVCLEFLPDDLITRTHDKVFAELKIPFLTALRGGQAVFKGMPDPIRVKVPKACSSGHVIEIKDERTKGLTLYLKLVFETPNLKSEAIKRIVKVLKNNGRTR